jgi:hypothetical protein
MFDSKSRFERGCQLYSDSSFEKNQEDTGKASGTRLIHKRAHHRYGHDQFHLWL